jgi:hypothetical protein
MFPSKNAKHEQNMTETPKAMQINLTCSRIRNQNPRHAVFSPLSESTPPHGVNGLILSDPNLLDPWSRIVGLVQVVKAAQDILHHA